MAGFVFDTFHTFTLALFALAGLLIASTAMIHSKAQIVNLENRPQHNERTRAIALVSKCTVKR